MESNIEINKEGNIISARRLPIGQKVVVQAGNDDEQKKETNGHVCIIKDIRKTIFAVTSRYKYELEWKQSDNPGRELPRFFYDNYYYMDDEVIPLTAHYPLAFDAEGLPDI